MSYAGVAITGRAGSGKTTLARAILELRHDWTHGSFAAALKSDLAALGIVKGDPGFREVAQAYGTDYARAKFGEDYWIQRLLDSNGAAGLTGLVIDDARFANELEVCRSAGLLLVRTTAGPETRAARLGRPCPEHASELNDTTVHITVPTDAGVTPAALAESVMRQANLTTVQIERVA